LRIHVRELRQEGAYPLLLVNGLGAHAGMWHVLEEHLHDFHLIEFDAPGTGLSPTSPIPVPIAVLARVAEGVLDHCGVPQADVLGYSMGGLVAQQLAISKPERVRRLVLAATTVGLGGVNGRWGPLVSIYSPLRFTSRRFYYATIGGMAGGRARWDQEWVARHGEVRQQAPPTMLGYAGQLVGGMWSTLPGLSRIDHPTLAVHGDDDPLVPAANMHLLTNRIPNARGQLLLGEGHLIPMDEGSAAFPKIVDFLTARDHRESRAWARGSKATSRELREDIARTRKAQPIAAAASGVRWLLS
jgi:pimeloyl-ACP methyl ester carboxylesterase